MTEGTSSGRFHLKCVQCEHIEPKSKEVSFNTQGIFSYVRYYRKEIFVKGRGPVGLRISRKNTQPLKDEVLCESERKNTLGFVEVP